jgi:hypothetical protein
MNTHKMSNPDKLTHGRDQTSRIWRKFMDYTGGAEKEGSSRAISVAIGEDYGPTRGALELMGHLKVIGTRSEYELRRQRVFYRPLMNLADGSRSSASRSWQRSGPWPRPKKWWPKPPPWPKPSSPKSPRPTA